MTASYDVAGTGPTWCEALAGSRFFSSWGSHRVSITYDGSAWWNPNPPACTACPTSSARSAGTRAAGCGGGRVWMAGCDESVWNGSPSNNLVISKVVVRSICLKCKFK